MNATTTTLGNMMYNSTMDMTWTSFGILPIVLMVMAAVAVIAAVLVLSSPAMLKRLLRIREFLISTFGCFFYGAGALMVFGSVYFVFSLAASDVSTGAPVTKTLLIILAGFVGISALGFLVKKLAVERIVVAYEKAMKKE